MTTVSLLDSASERAALAGAHHISWVMPRMRSRVPADTPLRPLSANDEIRRLGDRAVPVEEVCLVTLRPKICRSPGDALCRGTT